MNQKVKQQRFLKYLWLLNVLKKLTYGHLLGLGSGSGSGSGSGPRRPDPDPTKKVRIRPDADPQRWYKLQNRTKNTNIAYSVLSSHGHFYMHCSIGYQCCGAASFL
jgi:hypothetical protein